MYLDMQVNLQTVKPDCKYSVRFLLPRFPGLGLLDIRRDPLEVDWMIGIADNPAFQTYALCSSILALKLFWSSVYSGIQRQRNSGYTNPEDARVFGGEGVEAAPSEAPAVAHALRIQRNDGENIPAFFAIGLIFVLSGASASSAAIYLWTFTISRLAHTFFYTNQMQPWRAISFGVGALAVIGMAVQTIIQMV